MDDVDDDAVTSGNVVEMLQLQLSEYEMLQSMFPGDNELKIDDGASLIHIKSFVDGDSKYEYLHSRLGFSLNIASEDCKVCLK